MCEAGGTSESSQTRIELKLSPAFSEAAGVVSTARIERGPSNSRYLSLEEWPRLPFTARIGRAQFHRARSASKKGAWPLLPLPSKLARFSLQVGSLDWPLTAPVERGPS
jgi:hypothetical protein